MKHTTSLVLLAIASSAMACSGPAVNQDTINLITSFESFSDEPYTDATGNPTIGYGHLCQEDDCSDIGYSIPLSESDGEALLQSDLQVAEDCITNDTTSDVVLNANQYGALVSWAFNVGCGNAGSSTLISRLNNGEDPNTVIEQELPKWNKGNGQTIPGLTRRRAAEVDLAETATDEGALPAC